LKEMKVVGSMKLLGSLEDGSKPMNTRNDTATPSDGSRLTEGRLPLQRMFNEVPERYDLLNRLLTFGIDQSWRRRASGVCLEGGPARVMDLCTGTGDLALLLASDAGQDTHVTAVDFAAPMLEVARRKAESRGVAGRMELRLADAGELPFEDGELDAVGIAFAFRNLTYRNPRRDQYLSEIVRVLGPGGRLVIAETSQPSNGLWRGLFHIYLRAFVAPVGGILSGHRPAYRYLARSAENYFRPDDVSEMLEGAGFGRVAYRPFLGGVAALHVAIR
jgi:demethylmenaquinone methyltransferase/2-methoxy-6-polyprenyl-1,4-benzoquinol methylase